MDSFAGSAIIRVTYGARSASETEEYVQLAETAMESIRKVMVPGAFMVELFPFLKHIPAWLPGGGARKFADDYSPAVQGLRNKPFDEVKRAAVRYHYLQYYLLMSDDITQGAGRAIPSVSYSLIRQMEAENASSERSFKNDQIARDVTGIAYAGLSCFILRCIQAKLNRTSGASDTVCPMPVSSAGSGLIIPLFFPFVADIRSRGGIDLILSDVPRSAEESPG